MEPKRKSSGGDADDRASKRQKTAVDAKPSKETPATTTEVGLAFLEQIRRTGDKSGRKIATYFETLLPRAGNEAYYKAVRMPISLGLIEKKLRNGDFANLAELESYVKRMVQNAKDFYPRSSHTYDDAERIRKATSNYMVKHNPAYKLIPKYSAFPTPIPDDLADAEPDTDENGGADASPETNGKDADDADEDKEDGDADGDDDDEAEPASQRNGSSASRRKSASAGTAERATSVGAKPDHEYDGVPYKGLTFQQAQEKIVEELIRRPDEDDEGYAYFEPFLNLPPRSLKDYFQLIKDPLSLKKLQKMVKGIRGRGDRSGVSEFKSWAAFEEKASLLWENAYFYNEDGSPIAEMAKELEAMFRDELKQAKEVVSEPPQPKIKIKVAQPETPVSTSTTTTKRITIHVAHARGGSAESPAPKTGGAAPSDKSGAVTHLTVEKARSTSAASPTPSATATKHEDSARASPAVAPAAALSNGASPAPVRTDGATAVNGSESGTPAAAPVPAVPVVPAVPAVPARPAYESKFREAGQEPLITNLSLRTHPAINTGEKRFEVKLPAHAKLSQRSATLIVPQGQWRQQMTVSLAPAVLQHQRPFKLFVIANGTTLGQSAPAGGPSTDPAEAGGKVYEVNLHPGVNVIQVQVIAGVAKGQTLPSGADAELEKLTIFVNLMRY